MKRKTLHHRISSWRHAIGVALLLLAAQLQPSAAPTAYDLRADWSDVSNPSGPWSYNDGNGSIANHVSDYLPGAFSSPQPAWVYAATGPGHIVSWFRAAGTSGGTDWQVGDVVTHTWDSASSGGVSAPHSHVAWTSPGAGTIDLSGAVWLTRDIGRAVDWSLAINGLALSGGSLFSGDPFDRSNPFNLATGSGGSAVLNDIPVAPGDTIGLFFITRSQFGDFTGVDFHVEFTPVPEPSTLALLALCGLGGLMMRKLRRDNSRK